MGRKGHSASDGVAGGDDRGRCYSLNATLVPSTSAIEPRWEALFLAVFILTILPDRFGPSPAPHSDTPQEIRPVTRNPPTLKEEGIRELVQEAL